MYYLEGQNSPSIPTILLRKDKTLGSVLSVDLNKPYKTEPFPIAGLAVEFSRLKTDTDILNFANRYGFLGVNFIDDPEILNNNARYWGNFKYEDRRLELVSNWHWHIKQVGRLVKLYNYLQKGRDVEDLLRVEDFQTIMERLKGSKGPKKYEVQWNDGESTFVFYEDADTSPIVYANRVLYKNIIHMVDNGTHIDYYSAIKDESRPLGFKFADRKATPYLLAAIYYDLNRMINGQEEAKICNVCDRPFISKRSDAVFCGDACRKKNERQLKKLH